MKLLPFLSLKHASITTRKLSVRFLKVQIMISKLIKVHIWVDLGKNFFLWSYLQLIGICVMLVSHLKWIALVVLVLFLESGIVSLVLRASGILLRKPMFTACEACVLALCTISLAPLVLTFCYSCKGYLCATWGCLSVLTGQNPSFWSTISYVDWRFRIISRFFFLPTSFKTP